VGLVKRSRIKKGRRRILETEEKGLERGLQQWQEEILNMSMEEFNLMDEDWTLTNENEIPITQSQMKMLEKVLGDDF